MNAALHARAELRGLYIDYKNLLQSRDIAETAAARVREQIAAYNFAARRGHLAPDRERVARADLLCVSKRLRSVDRLLQENTERRRLLLNLGATRRRV